METLTGSQHPATLLKKCAGCNFILKNQLHLATPDQPPHFDLFCPNLTCFNFGKVAIRYTLEPLSSAPVVDDNLIHDTKPDTSIESD